MKKIMVYLLLVAMPVTSFCQTSDSVPLVKTDYLAKSKSQKTGAFILLGIGVATLSIAALGDVDFDALGVLVVVGGITTIASIPLFIAARRNKRKAKNITGKIKMEHAPFYQNQSFAQRSFPAFSMKLGL